MSRRIGLFSHWKHWLAAMATATLAACGGGGDGTPVSRLAAGGDATVPGSNVLAIRVDGGADGRGINAPYVSVTLCQPGTTTCATIDHVIVDTGSSGLRVAASALPPALRTSLPTVNAGSGAPAGQCAHFASGVSWGSVRQADVRLGSETASGISIQLVNDPTFAGIPGACSSRGDNIGAGGWSANGILGVGFFTQDCGVACVVSASPAVYFGCTGGNCTSSTMPLASQVSNPVASLPTNNNGVVMVLPSVPAGGVAGVTGSLVLGIGTQSNNQLGSARVLAADARGFFTTIYRGTAYTESFIDSGSNGLFFTDPTLPLCGDFYCPGSPVTLTATNVGANGVSTTESFLVDNVAALPREATAAHLAGDVLDVNGNRVLRDTFDWGLPFFFGRSVFVARSGANTPYGIGPYWAY